MYSPEYIAPQTIEEALEILADQSGGVKIIAGGTDLIPRLRSGALHPTLLLDLRKLGLDRIEKNAERIRIGACVTHSEILASDLLAQFCPALTAAAREIAGPPIRNLGTIGGNLVNASPAADLALPLLVYDASLVLARASAQREVRLVDFFTAPGQTVITPDEILLEIHIPLLPSKTASNFVKLGIRQAMAIAVTSVATRLSVDGSGEIAQARVALGSVAPRPMRAFRAEATLEGNTPCVELFSRCASEASQEATPISDIRASAAYRRQMVAVLTRRALAAAWQLHQVRNR